MQFLVLTACSLIEFDLQIWVKWLPKCADRIIRNSEPMCTLWKARNFAKSTRSTLKNTIFSVPLTKSIAHAPTQWLMARDYLRERSNFNPIPMQLSLQCLTEVQSGCACVHSWTCGVCGCIVCVWELSPRVPGCKTLRAVWTHVQCTEDPAPPTVAVAWTSTSGQPSEQAVHYTVRLQHTQGHSGD